MNFRIQISIVIFCVFGKIDMPSIIKRKQKLVKNRKINNSTKRYINFEQRKQKSSWCCKYVIFELQYLVFMIFNKSIVLITHLPVYFVLMTASLDIKTIMINDHILGVHVKSV